MVKSILASVNANLEDVTYKDTLSYFGILYQGKVTKICRLYFNTSKKSIIFPNEASYNIEKLEDIYQYKADIIKAFESRK